MAVKLSTERKFRAPVPMAWFDESGQQQQDAFTACFRVMSSDELDKPENAEKRLLDIVLVSVEDLELVDAAGQVLEGEALLEAAKCDPVIAGALIVAYRESNAKKPKQRISGKRS